MKTPEIRESVAHATPPRSLTCTGDSPIPSAFLGEGRHRAVCAGNGGETPSQPETQGGRPLVLERGGRPSLLGGEGGVTPSPPPLPPPKREREGAAPPPKGGEGLSPQRGAGGPKAPAPSVPVGCKLTDELFRERAPHNSCKGIKWFPFSRAMYKVTSPLPTKSPWSR